MTTTARPFPAGLIKRTGGATARIAGRGPSHRPAGSSKVRPTGGTSWHIADWGAWGTAETAVKVLAIMTAFFAAFPDGAFALPDSNRVTFWILVAIAVAYVGAIADRLADREITAMIFLAANLIGHWSIVYAMGAPTWPATPVRAFITLMLIGDLIKIIFFVRTGARIRNWPRFVPIVLTGGFVTLYAIALLAAG